MAGEHGSSSKNEVTQLLLDWSAGDEQALKRLIPIVVEDLRRRAAGYLRRERRGHTLQPTALVNEVYLRLVDQKRVQWRNRAHFFGVAAQLMRRILVDHARAHQAEKRGGWIEKVALDEAVDALVERDIDVIALDEALARLSGLHQRKGRVVELRFFAGLTLDETAEVLGVTRATISRDWRGAKAWLARELRRS